MAIFSTAGFSLAYYLFTFFAIEASFAIAWGHWRRDVSFKARRLALAFGWLGVLRFIFFFAFSTQAAVIKVPLEQALMVISLGFLAWSFSPVLTRQKLVATGFLIGNTGLALLFFAVDAWLVAGNLTVVWLLWQIAVGLFLLASQIRQLSPDQIFTTTGVLVLVLGALFQIIWGNRQLIETGAAVFTRLSEMVAYPILVIAVYQEVVESINVQRQALKSLSQATQEQIQGLISLFESTQAIIATLNTTQVLEGAAKGVALALNVDVCAIALPLENEPDTLRLVATHNPHRQGRGEAVSFPVSEQHAIKHALERMRQVKINTAHSDPQLRFLFALMGAVDQTGPLVIQPLILHDTPIGVLLAGNPYSRRAFIPTEFQLIHSLANQTAIALENARAYQGVVNKSHHLAWTLRNKEQDSSRKMAALEAELQKSREETTIISQKLYEQESIARRSQQSLTDYQQQISALSTQMKAARRKIETVLAENKRLATISSSRREHGEKLRQAEEEIKSLREQLTEANMEAGEAQKLSRALQELQTRSRKLARALRISHRKQQQAAAMPLALTSPQINTELENMSCGVLISNQQGKIDRVNPATAALFNMDSSKLIGKKMLDVIDDDQWRQTIRQSAKRDEGVASATLTLGERVVKATVSPITNPGNGQVNGSIVILYDATEEFETQQARDEFVASLAQELRTPMTSIIGYVDLLLGESVGMIGDMQRKFLQRVKANIERMESLLNDLIGIAAIDAGQLEINPVALDIAEIVEEAIIGAKTQIEEKEIQLQLNLPEHTPVIEADPACMQQVMVNLLSNATKTTPVGGMVEVRAGITDCEDCPQITTDDEEQKWLRISITDSGGGIAEKDAGRVFERLYKADNPLIQGLGETGVGLSIVKHLIEAHNGAVWFDTEMGKGTTFHFALPIVDYVNDPWQEVDVPPLDLNSDH